MTIIHTNDSPNVSVIHSTCQRMLFFPMGSYFLKRNDMNGVQRLLIGCEEEGFYVQFTDHSRRVVENI